MANVILNIPDTILPRVVDAFTVSYGYNATMPDGTPNPETQNAFVKRKIAEYIKGVVVAYEINREADNARRATEASSKSQITIS